MNNRLKYLCGVVMFATVAFVGCISKERVEVEIINVGDLDKLVSTGVPDNDFIDSCSIVKLESTNNLIVAINQIEIFDGRIFLLDKQQKRLFVFDINGKYLNDIGKLGRGEGEFSAISAFYINPQNKTLAIADPLTSSVLRYSMVGNFIGKQRLDKTIAAGPISSMRYIQDNKILCYSNPNMFDEKMLFVLNENDFTVSDIISKSPFKPDIGAYVFATQPYSVVSGEIHYVSPFKREISAYLGGQNEHIILMNDGKKELDAATLSMMAEKQEYNYFSTALDVIKGKTYSAGLQNFFESSRFIIGNFMFGDNFIWDKKNQTGCVFAPAAHLPGLSGISYSKEDVVVKIWDSPQIERFKEELNAGNLQVADYNQTIIDIANRYDAWEDNPVLFVFYMKS